MFIATIARPEAPCRRELEELPRTSDGSTLPVWRAQADRRVPMKREEEEVQDVTDMVLFLAKGGVLRARG